VTAGVQVMDVAAPPALAITLADGYEGLQYFLDGVSLPVTFTATVDWGGHPPGVVQFITQQQTLQVNAGNGRASQVFDVGTYFGPGGTLQVMAISSDGAQSPALVAPFCVMPSIPPFTFYPIAGNEISYTTGDAGPNWPVVNYFVDEGLIPSSIPVFGGKPVTINVIPTVGGTIQGSSLTLKATFDGAPQFEEAGLSGQVTPDLSVTAQFSNGQWNWGGSVGVAATIDASSTWQGTS
jgi:hypothetical protein